MLLLDSEPLVTEVTARFLEERGFDAIRAHTTDEAFRRLAEARVDALVMEIFLAGEDGMDFLCRCRMFHPDVPIIVLSRVGYDELFMEEARRAGVSAYVSKETEIENVMAAIRQVLSEKKECRPFV